MKRLDRQLAGQELGADVRLDLVLCLPRTPATVALVRHLLDAALAGLGVIEDCRAEVVLAANEACANAVAYAHDSSDYRIAIGVKQGWCSVEVVDTGSGLDGRRQAGRMPESAVHGGRGLPIMRAVTDTLTLRPSYPSGLTVGFTKRLHFAGEATNGE